MRTYGFFLLMVFGLFGCRSAPVDEQEAIRRALEMEESDQQAEHVRLTVSHDGNPRLWLQAAYLERNDDDSLQVRLSGTPVRGRIYSSEGAQLATFEAGEVRYEEKEKRFVLVHAVTVRARDGRVLTTERLIWEEGSGRLMAPGFVRLRAEGEEIQGYRLHADEDLTHYTMARVTGQVTLRE